MEPPMEITKRAIPRFRVAENAEGLPFIVIERSSGEDLWFFKNIIGFDLQTETAFEEANAISRYLNSNISRISETIFS
jgi:hypothetical protein